MCASHEALPMKRSPLARGKDRGVPPKVRAQVRARSGGFCEVCDVPRRPGWENNYVLDLHHLVKRPRLHESWAIVHLCRRHHEMCEAPYAKGRLVFDWDWNLANLGPKDTAPLEIKWRIEVRARKDGPLLRTLGEGRIQL